RVVSMVEIGKEKIESIGKRLGETFPHTSEALSDYELKPNLFKWKEYVSNTTSFLPWKTSPIIQAFCPVFSNSARAC
ncbi:MAG: hypothetical protein KAW19_00865, partial [Candidatus Aminicenantes bacterium]|nr:hypothetical protein [Candidatus Aminicenantes bacterium]